MSYQSRRLDHFGIVAGMCDRIKLVETIDSFIPRQERKVTVGEAVKAMVINALGFSSRPLYLSPEFFSNKPIDLLFRPGLSPEDFNDDSLGRALDSLFLHDITSIFGGVASHSLSSFGIAHRFYHLDTSSFSFYGQYDIPPKEVAEGEPIPIHICKGYSKDHRPELKQAVLSLICAYKSSLPVWLEALDGNSSDKKSFPQTIEAFTEQISEGDRPCFIVDSALYTSENLEKLSDVYWLTRVPETISLAKEVIAEVTEEDLVKTTDSSYQLCEYSCDYGGSEHRWWVVYSEQAKQRELKSFRKRLDKAKAKAEKELERFSRQEFSCQQDAEAERQRIQKKWKYHIVSEVECEQVLHYKGKGRPRKGTKPESVGWKVNGKLAEKEDAIKEIERTLGRFIIATNMPENMLSGEDALENYKSQGSSVERGFRFLKDPMFFADGMYLQKPERIMSLLMVMTLSLLVYALAEKELRRQLVENDDFIPDQKGKPTQKITMRRVFQMFEGIDVLNVQTGGATQQLILNVKDEHQKIFRYLGYDVQKYYERE